ncbi:hypothetical protein TYRP_015728 [Tyrophagus putrescentiae]|nr:hypothetical protein TYRP_015728 [Tyrophagus putrescentiae]
MIERTPKRHLDTRCTAAPERKAAHQVAGGGGGGDAEEPDEQANEANQCEEEDGVLEGVLQNAH